MRRGNGGGAGRGGSSASATIRTFYVAFLQDIYRSYSSDYPLPATMDDFHYYWEQFQSSNRKLRSSVVELVDFEKETVLEYLRDELNVLTFDIDKNFISWNMDSTKQVCQRGSDRQPVRGIWKQATCDWNQPKSQTSVNRAPPTVTIWGQESRPLQHDATPSHPIPTIHRPAHTHVQKQRLPEKEQVPTGKMPLASWVPDGCSGIPTDCNDGSFVSENPDQSKTQQARGKPTKKTLPGPAKEIEFSTASTAARPSPSDLPPRCDDDRKEPMPDLKQSSAYRRRKF
uniref:Uncharacterized protein n=1 Tax=Spongospora subterranea TaxID=70186 RepID=A0A0H5R8K8_9EUKA|eukprot:CRZ10052.1 hypothetical protein [Spongospora subterranea]